MATKLGGADDIARRTVQSKKWWDRLTPDLRAQQRQAVIDGMERSGNRLGRPPTRSKQPKQSRQRHPLHDLTPELRAMYVTLRGSRYSAAEALRMVQEHAAVVERRRLAEK